MLWALRVTRHIIVQVQNLLALHSLVWTCLVWLPAQAAPVQDCQLSQSSAAICLAQRRAPSQGQSFHVPLEQLPA